MLLKMSNSTNTTNIVTTLEHAHLTDLKLKMVSDLTSGVVKHDGVVDLDGWIREADGAAIVSDDVWAATFTELCLVNLAKLVVGLILVDLVDNETTLGIVEHTEMLVSLLKGDNIHETSWEADISTNLVVNLNETLHADLLNLLVGKSVLEAVTEKDGKRHALTELVWTGGWAWRPITLELIHHPVAWRVDALHMLLWSTSHGAVSLSEKGIKKWW